MLKIDELVQDDDGVNRTILITFLSLRCANISNFIYMEGNCDVKTPPWSSRLLFRTYHNFPNRAAARIQAN